MYETHQENYIKQIIMKTFTKRTAVFLILSLIGWALCGATMKIGMAITTTDNALIIHAIAAPIFFGILTFIYVRRYNEVNPLRIALGFTGFIIGMDFFIVAPIFEQSYEMFYSLLGTWIPFGLIFLSSYLMTKLKKQV